MALGETTSPLLTNNQMTISVLLLNALINEMFFYEVWPKVCVAC